ncbi:afadin-like [Brachionichthys hirsutus]|uniref:afadin-like n=1 Tax=Brachionichthys hirsutus TaxID=412623 RepID=UPI0036044FD0
MPEDEEREKLGEAIRRWNDNRLDLFEISHPDEDLAFYGVMRFYFEDHAGGNVATKCIRVCSSSSTREVVETLCEKFRPDMKMLTTSHSLYEIRAKKERKLDPRERPLVVQLNWSTDDRGRRFVLKAERNCHEKEKGGVMQNFKRTLSRKDKKREKTRATLKDSEKGGLTEKHLNDVCESDREIQTQRAESRTQQELKQAGGVNPDVSDGPGLPIRLQFPDQSEDVFLSAVINCSNSATVHFKLSPAYILYAAGRLALQRQRSGGRPRSGQMHGVTEAAGQMVAAMKEVIQTQQAGAGALAFWMANSSELLNFLRRDHDLCPLTRQAQLELSHLVHKAYSCLSQVLQNELRKHLHTFLIDPEHHGPLPAATEAVLNTLMNSMSLLRRCRVNPALTIQLFSQLFHFTSAWLFNRLMSPEADAPGLRSNRWGAALRRRLMAIEAWAERQGLELAANCHLGHIMQATTLLTMNKNSMQQAAHIQNSCFKLNSLQLRALLVDYLYADDEPRIPAGLIHAVVMAAEASADKLIRSGGWDIQLEERLDLCLPFLLPEGGYSCDTVKGIPQGLKEFMEPICRKGICSLTSQLNSKGDWTVYFSEPAPSADSTFMAAHTEPEVVTIMLKKPQNSGMGVSIVAAKGAGQNNVGIYIKSIVNGGPAQMNGRLTAGDQLLSVDGQSLVGLSQDRAAALIMQTGPVMKSQVAKFGARCHGLWAPLTGSAAERNAADFGSEGGDGPAVRRNDMAAVSNANLCADGRRQAVSQDNLCLDGGDPLLDRRPNSWDQHAKQTTSHCSSFPIRSSVSAHDIFSDQGSRRSGVAVWRSPFPQNPTPSIQPIRIDVPVTRAMNIPTNPPLKTFQSSKSQTLNGNILQNQSPQYYVTPTKTFLSQQHRSTQHQDKPAKPRVAVPPAKHVSFQEPPTHRKHSSGPDPWRREVQRQFLAVELLGQEVQGLQAKAACTAERNRLQKLSLEWQFQKRLQEIQQRGEDEEEEDLDMMLTIQQLETRVQNNRSLPDRKAIANLAGTHLSQEDKAKTDLRKSAQSQEFKADSERRATT